MANTAKYNEGYRYYVYVGPGHIEYFYTLREAMYFQEDNGGNIGEVD